MALKPAFWYPIAVVLSAINLVAAGFAIGSAEPWHAALHGALAAALGWWARRLRAARTGGGSLEARLDALESETTKLRQELNEAHERLDFTERVLAQGSEARRLGPQR